MQNLSHKEQLVQIYCWLRKFDLNDSHSGNASIRVGDIIWVTPSGACADSLTVNDLIKCHIDGTIPAGASLDAPLHVQCYQKNANTQAVLHSHNPHALALTMKGEDFIPTDFEGAYYFPSVPVASIPYEKYVEQAPSTVSDLLSEHKACIVQGHGIYVAGESLNLAYKWTCSLELSAKIAFLQHNSN